MKALPFVACVALGAATLAPACSANSLVVGYEIDSGGPDACLSAGGCLTFPDASPGRDAGADAGPGSKDGGNDGASACASAGGMCVESSMSCAETAATGAQDCNAPANPGAAHCCLTLPDAGPGRDAGPRDASPDSDAGRSGDSGTSPLCAAAGGTCIDNSVACGKNGPGTAQDCPFVAGGSFCCLMPL